jgi:hypothetical protein
MLGAPGTLSLAGPQAGLIPIATFKEMRKMRGFRAKNQPASYASNRNAKNGEMTAWRRPLTTKRHGKWSRNSPDLLRPAAEKASEQLLVDAEQFSACRMEPLENASELAIEISINQVGMDIVFSANCGCIAEGFGDVAKDFLHDTFPSGQFFDGLLFIEHTSRHGGGLPGAKVFRREVMTGSLRQILIDAN